MAHLMSRCTKTLTDTLATVKLLDFCRVELRTILVTYLDEITTWIPMRSGVLGNRRRSNWRQVFKKYNGDGYFEASIPINFGSECTQRFTNFCCRLATPLHLSRCQHILPFFLRIHVKRKPLSSWLPYFVKLVEI